MSISSHLSTCVGTQSPKYLEMAQGHISLSISYSSEITLIRKRQWGTRKIKEQELREQSRSRIGKAGRR
jgi:hypothetical protein